MTPRELANKLLHFYQNDPKRWTQGTFARDVAGLKAHIFESDACSFCAIGAARKMMSTEPWGEFCDDLAFALGYYNLASFNDECASFEEFKTKLEKIANEP